MKKSMLLVCMAALACSSCVTLGKYEELESRNVQLRRDINATQSELNDLRDENADLQRQNQALNSRITDLNDIKNQQSDSLALLQREIVNLQLGFDTVIENYNQKISGQNQDLTRTNNLLAARTKELNDKEAAFKKKEENFKIQENQLRTKQAELEQKEADARKALAAKERELENLRSSLNNALVGFADKGMKVETRDGKVYVSMDSKLLFPSASWTVSKEGVEALKSLAKVLEENTDLNIMVEGHTDNAAYKGSTAVKDNWDLSVMRATSIVKLLLQHGKNIDPARIEACGHAEFAPKVPNDTPANKALNRRTEIILTPKMSDILNLIEK
ncbi:MAG: OmpA family protein [Bacteroidales bacterium]|nr:OmpA family protein [Bacteroidales bacterium]MCR5191738.1 OmpA family protein [Bacteroidales bacterium]